ncbi:thioredoxin [Paraglaciecola aquimarina]|uniref:Thioredoxin n=1 Tax=Paraglaciecola algarum TaxID=3050085 RepID=A0ABS9D953_9ALTE|nr:thioredoxin [Paraglaciecola sp. G1-23]MCF2949401.1 thioredoxin [Paraglaciecola sp. G1-23]
MSNVTVINPNDFEQEVSAHKGTVLVDFFAQWCGPCKMIAPILDQLSTENDEIKIVKVDADEAQDLMVKFGIRGIPTLLLFKDGELAATKVGALSFTDLKAFVA